jgi:hypothetical protein
MASAAATAEFRVDSTWVLDNAGARAGSERLLDVDLAAVV